MAKSGMKSKTKYHRTAGGVVVNDSGEVLVLRRTVARDGALVHEVRLPKGHIDAGESETAAAMREVGEESGYWDVAIMADLGMAHSSFTFKGKQRERDERYFLMCLTRPERGPAAPEGTEEALFEPEWLPLGEAPGSMTYASERDFVERARLWLSENH